VRRVVGECGPDFSFLLLRPQLLDGAPAKIMRMTEKRLGVKFHYHVTPQGVELVPSEGTDEGGALRGHLPLAHPQ